MKAMLALMLAAMLAMGAGVSAGGAIADGGADAANRLGMNLLRRDWDGAHNALISPVSLAYALDMAAAGAAGQTYEELKICDAPRWNVPLTEAGLRWANAAFVNEGLAVKPEYRAALAEDFGAELFTLTDVDAVNDWARARTDGLIDPLTDRLDPRTRLLLLNAVAMDARWRVEFDAGNTAGGDFHAPGGDVTADFMNATYEMPYAEGPLGQAARLDYRDSGLYMLVVLPEAGKLESALDALAMDPLGAMGELSPRKVVLSLPKLDFTAENKLSEGLQALGIREAFTDGADLSGISEEPLMVSDVFQKARLQVDEAGTRAAAVTEMTIVAKGMNPEEDPPARLTVDRPFILIIAEEQTGAVCFAAAVCDPTQK